jgi:hypothetical protein
MARSRPSSRFDSDGAYGEYRGEVDILGNETAEGWLISPNYFFSSCGCILQTRCLG